MWQKGYNSLIFSQIGQGKAFKSTRARLILLWTV